MPYTASYGEDLTRKLAKIRKKYRKMYDVIMKKVDEILYVPEHYKPLRHDLHGYRRVHIMGPFVLVFKVDEATQTVSFVDFDHHDKIYKKRY